MTTPIAAKELARLLDEYAGPLSLYASQWTRSPEDSVQEAFVALASRIPPPENRVAWLYRVVRNIALNELRTSQRRVSREQKAASQIMSAATVDELESNEQRNELLQLLERMEPGDRELIVLRIWSGLTWVEIAELTGTSSSSAQRNYVAALEQLRKKLESKCLTNPN